MLFGQSTPTPPTTTDTKALVVWAAVIVLTTTATVVIALAPFIIGAKRAATAAHETASSVRADLEPISDSVNHRHPDANGTKPPPLWDTTLATKEAVGHVLARVDETHEHLIALAVRQGQIAAHVERLMTWQGEFESRWTTLPDEIADGRRLGQRFDTIDAGFARNDHVHELLIENVGHLGGQLAQHLADGHSPPHGS